VAVVRGDWDGIPGDWISDATAPEGRRFVASKSGYVRVRKRLCLSVGRCCEECGRATPLDWGQLHHVFGRGIGGSKREDRRQVLGVIFTVWLCRNCHDLQVIREWGSWVIVKVLDEIKGRDHAKDGSLDNTVNCL
jgi:hypothetical protein